MMGYYVWNCFWLMFPVLFLNILFARRLPPRYQPAIFSHEIPRWIQVPENIFRIGTFLLPLLMPIQIVTSLQKFGIALYVAGLLLYFSSWAMQMRHPQSAWSRSRLGFMAPAYTPGVWLTGIALIGDSFYLSLGRATCIYLVVAISFLLFHNLHAWIVHSRA
jgi:hypothetical protein